MSFSRKARQALSLPPHIVIKKIFQIGKKIVKKKIQRKKDYRTCTYSLDFQFSDELRHYTEPTLRESLLQYKDTIDYITKHFCQHEFDILGSGWILWNQGICAQGVGGFHYPTTIFNAQSVKVSLANTQEHRRILTLISDNYSPIDWQRDCKSGYRWSEALWHKDNTYGTLSGVDVKVPWELARCHHSVYLAYSYLLSDTQEQSEKFAKEFCNQILDFIAYNPPRFGVNWVTSMDVGIRAANWLTAYDLFISYGYTFSDDFIKIFTRSIYEHCLHIMNNLEWSSDLRGNHYLADCVGVLYCAAYLPCSPQTDAWLAFSIQEICAEILLQFLPDGSNFEASIPYHRLSLEMTLFAVSLILNLPDDKIAALSHYDHTLVKGKPTLLSSPLPLYSIPNNIRAKCTQTPISPDIFSRLKKAISFSRTMIEFAEEIPQIGDNDSGRFMKLTPEYILKDTILMEKENSHTHLLSLAAGIFTDSYLNRYNNDFPLETLYTKSLNRPLRVEVLEQGKDTEHFPDFGLTVFKKSRYSCAIRAGSIGQKGKGGHAHNDQLSFCIAIDGIMLCTDPGTYLYTPLWQERNRFRSTAMHNTLAVESMEQNNWVSGPGDVLFWMLGDTSHAKTLEYSANHYSGEHYGFGVPHRRTLHFSEFEIKAHDLCTLQKSKSLHFHIAPSWIITQETSLKIIFSHKDTNVIFTADSPIIVKESLFSEGYGKVEPISQLIIPMTHNECVWSLTLER